MNWLINFIIRVYTRIACRIDAPNLQKIPMQGPLIIITNHTGQIEVPLLFAHLQPRKMTGWAKIEAWDNKFLNWVFNVWGIIPVRRGEADMHALKAALRALEVKKITAEHPKKGKEDYEGVSLNALLDLAGLKDGAKTLLVTAADGYTAEIDLAAVRACADCLLGFTTTAEKFKMVMPGLESNFWVKDVVKIEVK